MPPRAQAFVHRIFSPGGTGPLFREGKPAGRELGRRWRFEIDYALAELGCAARPGLELRGLASRHREGGTLFLAASAVSDGGLTHEFLPFDLPYALIDRPCTLRDGSPEEKVAARFAATDLCLSPSPRCAGCGAPRSPHPPRRTRGWEGEGMSEGEIPPSELRAIEAWRGHAERRSA